MHLIVERCDTHDCSREAAPQSCSEEDHDGGVCNDTSITGHYLPAQHHLPVFIASPPSRLPDCFNSNAAGDTHARIPTAFSTAPPRRTTVLRI